VSIRVARWFVFTPKIPVWVNFGGLWNGKCWYVLWPFGKHILRPFGTIYGRLVNWIILPVLVCLDLEKSGNPGVHQWRLEAEKKERAESLLNRGEQRAVQHKSGWPDRANFRLWGDCFLWVAFVKITEAAQIVGLFFHGSIYVPSIFRKKWIGLHFGRHFNKRIWTPWTQCST
jgi:hypothetical protein